ncbi:pilin [Patescibacteria group bacterium]|nr:pilin [Patescibacteria group bacterium]
MKFLRERLTRIVSIAFLLLLPISSKAAGTTCDPGKICNPIPNITSVPGLIQTILTGVLKIGIPVIALAIIYSGFLFVTAQGKPEAITKAKSAFLTSIIGAAILLGSWALAKLISETVLAL